MKMLLCNIPMLESHGGTIHTGPNGGSCWSHCVPGLYSYVPFPFFMANATAHLKANGVDVDMFDAWAYRLISYDVVFEGIKSRAPEILVLEASTPVINQVLAMAERCKKELGCRIVITGPHTTAFHNDLLQLPYVDHVVAGEYESPCLKIANGSTQAYFEHDMLREVDFWPYRDPAVLKNYLDPSMYHAPIQLQVNDARGCPGFQCSYCAWPEVMYEHKYRARSAENVLAEIRDIAGRFPIGSLFFDSETWNGGRKERIAEMCVGLKQIGIPWTFMGRTDLSSDDEFRMFFDAGCVGCRLAPETFHQHLLDRVNKRLDAKASYRRCEWLAQHAPQGFQFRMLTMFDLPGMTTEEEKSDEATFTSLQRLGSQHGVRVDVQRARCTPMPGTKLWRELQAAGEGSKMGDFSEYSALPDAKSPLSKRLNTYAATVKGKATPDIAPRLEK